MKVWLKEINIRIGARRLGKLWLKFLERLEEIHLRKSSNAEKLIKRL
jgi:hypothetical protein